MLWSDQLCSLYTLAKLGEVHFVASVTELCDLLFSYWTNYAPGPCVTYYDKETNSKNKIIYRIIILIIMLLKFNVNYCSLMLSICPLLFLCWDSPISQFSGQFPENSTGKWGSQPFSFEHLLFYVSDIYKLHVWLATSVRRWTKSSCCIHNVSTRIKQGPKIGYKFT